MQAIESRVDMDANATKKVAARAETAEGHLYRWRLAESNFVSPWITPPTLPFAWPPFALIVPYPSWRELDVEGIERLSGAYVVFWRLLLAVARTPTLMKPLLAAYP
jgi:hypothetical protein